MIDWIKDGIGLVVLLALWAALYALGAILEAGAW